MKTAADWQAEVQAANARYHSSTPQQRRVAIARDVLALIHDRKLIAESVYFGRRLRANDGESDILPALQRELDDTECVVCGIGALFVSAVRLFDNCTIHMTGMNARHVAHPNMITVQPDEYGIRGVLRYHFVPAQVQLVELFFEGAPTTCENSPEDKDQLFDKYRDAIHAYRNTLPNVRLRLIMENILVHGGEFNPDIKPQLVDGMYIIPGFDPLLAGTTL